jgi:hypothetical protein
MNNLSKSKIEQNCFLIVAALAVHNFTLPFPPRLLIQLRIFRSLLLRGPLVRSSSKSLLRFVGGGSNRR